jgi:uncharacterized protein YdcH (DUF465 family)
LTERRESRLRELGAAVYGGDDSSVKRLTDEVRHVDEQMEEKEGQMTAIAESAQERLQKGRLHVDPTVIKRPEDEE